ncbi:hydrogenase large subunit [Thermococcus sp. CX2]|uniref:hydrogenase large subunit n=1 Tax=Thermococcus sp. CX2 TaxID=163006 RepID=UPI0014390B59|nr:NADH-quinone oxidoreductase subunit C [Thermococcus sp. CX2]NJE84528.1 hydrogenase large subunit [Thermococcus sp. CX2]
MLEEFEKKFEKFIRRKKWLSGNQVLYVVDRAALQEMVLYWHERGDSTHYSMSVGTDERPVTGTFSYIPVINVAVGRKNLWILLKAYLPAKNPTFPAVAEKLPAALWAEREVHDLLGLKPENHPDLRRLVLPEDWPENVYPLRKDVSHDYSPLGKRKGDYKPGPEDTTVVPLGPYHVALDEPAHFRLFVEGERIVDVEYRGFYSHRSIEKIGESRLGYNQIPFIAERICGICSFQFSTAYVQAIETIVGADVPERALYIRTVLLELERIHSHLLWMGVTCHMAGFDLGFMHTWRIREPIMWLVERLTGNRRTYGMNTVGGVRRDFLDYRKELVLKKIQELKNEFEKIRDLILNTNTFIRRIEGIGVLPKKLAKDYSVLGPNARASGINIDIRRDYPYAAYKDIDFRVPVYRKGDVLSRVLQRMDELMESVWIVEQAIDEMPGGEIYTPIEKLPEYQEILSYCEAPRGELVMYVMTEGGNRIYRWKVRPPTYNTLPVVPEVLKEYTVADAPLIITSFDPCYSCTERIQVVDVKRGKARILTAPLTGGCG